MESLEKRKQEWQNRNPLVVWRKAQGLTRRQAAERFGMTDRRLLELELGFGPLDVEWTAITSRAGVTRDQWAAWERERPRVGV